MDRPVSGLRRVRPTIRRALSVALGIVIMAFVAVPSAAAPALPKPKEFVSYLDLECFKTDPYQPPAVGLTLRHLNPVLESLPIEQITLGAREQLCVPVAKNNVIPPPEVLDFIRFVDLACYRVLTPAPGKALVLSHLNPVLQDLPRTEIVLGKAEQFCVPVAKNGVAPPAEVMQLVQHIDLLCYGITPNTPMNRALNLRQLNPVLTDQIPAATVRVTYARQLCVPMQKRGDIIPSEVLEVVRWVDLEKFDTVAPAITPVTLSLRHLNPVFGQLPPERATLTGAVQLGVPVAKNGQIPPG